MPNKKLFFIVIGAIALTIILIAKHTLDACGLPAIESKIDIQLVELVSNTPALSKFPVGAQEGAKIVGNNPPFTGKIWYQTQVDGETADLVVYWEGSSNECHIEKIGVQGTYLSPRIIWQH